MVDDAWATRIPQGWIRFPDGSIGPPNGPPGSDWNAPYRQPSGMGYPTSGILPPEAPGTPDQVSGRVGYPGIPTRTSPAMSAPALGGAAEGSTFDPRRPPGFIPPRWGGGPPPGFSMDDEGSTFDPRRPPGFKGPKWGGGPPPGFSMDDAPSGGERGSFGDPYSRWEKEAPWKYTEPSTAGGGGSSWDPRTWFKADPTATFEPGKPMPSSITG